MNDGKAPVGRSDAAARVARLVRSEVRMLSAYTIAKADGMVKLDANENPYALPEEVRGRLLDALARVPINRYPDGGADAVKAALRTALKLPDGLGLLLGNGSDELIHLISQALAKPGATVLAPEPTFVMYRLDARYAGMRFVGVPLKADFSLDCAAMLEAIAREAPALVFLAYPNNPTGNLFATEDVEAIVHATPGLVVIDEAYQAFADASFLPRIGEFSNMLVLRTLSKVGMAGIRLGYAIAAQEWIVELNKLRQPYNVNSLTQAAALVLLADPGWLVGQAAAIIAERTRLGRALAALPGVIVHATQANFVAVRVPDANALFEGLKARRILVKNLHGSHTLLANCLRLTVGTPEENDTLLAALRELCRPS
jgi:histidinol-phosphate aminotransferase